MLRTIINGTAAACAVTVAIFAAPATAVPTYGDIASPGVFFGSGNVNGNWTIDTDNVNHIEVALRAKDRATLQTIDGSAGAYRANTGICNPTCSGGTKAAWNYEFSVNTGTDLSNYLVRIRVDTDPGAGQSWTSWVDVLTNWSDNDYWSGSKRHASGPGALAGEFAVQQSVNPLFSDSLFQPGFDPYTPGVYEIELAVFSRQDTSLSHALASTAIVVQVPEPGALALVGLGLAAVGFGRRRKAVRG